MNVFQYGGNDVTVWKFTSKRRNLTAAYYVKCACRLYVYHFILVPETALFLVISTKNILVSIALSPSLSRRFPAWQEHRRELSCQGTTG